MNHWVQFSRFKLLFVLVGLICLLPIQLKAEEFVELTIPLEDGHYFSLRNFCGECNRVLGSHFDLDSIRDRRFELTPGRASLKGLLNQSDAFRTGHGDGLVSIASARIKGAASECLFDLNHLEFLSVPPDRNDSDVVRWVLEILKWKEAP
jgi:hypothetical protein